MQSGSHTSQEHPLGSQPITARILQADDSSLRLAADALRSGNLVAIPTETVYGLAANALDPAACQKIFAVKGRPLLDPLIVHVADLETARTLAHFSAPAERLATLYWPGPLTLVLPKRPAVPPIVTAGLDSVAIRCPAHPVARRLLALCALPLAAPSANPFGYLSPTRPQHVLASLGHKIDIILDGGPSSIGIESTILDLRDPANPTLLRHGSIPPNALETTLGARLRTPSTTSATTPQLAPGNLPSHYSPHTPLHLLPNPLPTLPTLPHGAALILYTRSRSHTPHPFHQHSPTYWLTEDASPSVAAHTLYHLLNQLDSQNLPALYLQLPPQQDQSPLAHALRDRMTRAASKRP